MDAGTATGRGPAICQNRRRGSSSARAGMSANPQPHPTRPEEYPPADTAHHWAKASKDLRHRLTQVIPHGVLKELHRKSPARHFAIAVRQFLLLAATSYVSWNYPQPWIWIPSALIAGWTAFNFTVLLHEVVHRAVAIAESVIAAASWGNFGSPDNRLRVIDRLCNAPVAAECSEIDHARRGGPHKRVRTVVAG